MIGLILDLARQVRGLLRPTYGGTGNTRVWARGTVLPYSNRSGASLPLMTAVRSVVAGGPRIEPTDTDAEEVLGVVVGYFDVTGKLVEDDAADNTNEVAVLVDGVTNVLTSAEIDLGDYAYASTTAGQVYGDAALVAGAFGRFLGRAGADGYAPVRILPTSAASGGGGAPDTADYLVGTTQAGLSAEIVVGTSPGGELGGTWASPTVDTTHSGSTHASRAPASADYLVGTADAGLSGEIVVGTTPGGELGNTWASPTVDASHSGSTHASVAATAASDLAAHTGDTVDAHDASAVSILDSGAYFSGGDTEAALQELGAAAWGGGGLTSPIAGWTGDGSDGAADLDGTNTYSWATKTGSVYVLNRDVFLTDLTIRAGSTLQDVHTNGNTGFFRIYATGTINNAGTIQFVGFPATVASGQGGVAATGLNSTLRGGSTGANGRLNTVAAGVAGTANTDVGGGAGGNGGSAGAQGGGAGAGTFAINNGSYRTLPWVTQGWFSGSPTANNPARITGGGGGGSGGCNGAATTNSGPGGGGGGVIVLVAPTIINSGTISVRGGDGGTAGGQVSGGSTSAAGGGGGGGGGVIFLTYHTLTNTGTITAAGGTKGNGVTGGNNGVDGSTGAIIQTHL